MLLSLLLLAAPRVAKAEWQAVPTAGLGAGTLLDARRGVFAGDVFGGVVAAPRHGAFGVRAVASATFSPLGVLVEPRVGLVFGTPDGDGRLVLFDTLVSLEAGPAFSAQGTQASVHLFLCLYALLGLDLAAHFGGADPLLGISVQLDAWTAAKLVRELAVVMSQG